MTERRSVDLPADGVDTVQAALELLAGALDDRRLLVRSTSSVIAGAPPPERPDQDALIPPDVALVIATSGSTGVAKDVMITVGALQHSAGAALDRLGGGGQWSLALPLSSIAGIGVLTRSLRAGTTPVVVDQADGFTVDGFVAATGRLDAPRRYTALVPTQLWRLAAGPAEGLEALRTYDAVLVGGAPLDDQLDHTIVTSGVRLVRSYGMTETCGGCVYDGVPLDGVEVHAPAVGAIEIGGPVVFSGYLGRPDLTAASLRVEDATRWHLTNDLGHRDADGRLCVDGRVDDMIISGGIKIATHVVANALASMEAIAQVVVLGSPDEEWGEIVTAYVVPVEAQRPLTLADLRAAATQVLPRHALPRRLVVIDSIPLLSSGKPDREALREMGSRQGRVPPS